MAAAAATRTRRRAHTARRRAPAPVRSGNVTTARRRRKRRAAGILDSLLRGRGWIGLVGVLLAGIVFFNVGLLELNSGIASSDQKASDLKRENAALRARVARLGSSERIQKAAAQIGLVLPQPGQVRYLKAGGRSDARRAVARLSLDQQDAATTVATTTQQTAAPQAQAPVQPQAPAQPQAPVQTTAQEPQPQAAPAPTPAPTAAPAPQTQSPGGAAAPTG
jgi:cell division protein FtsL